MPSTTRNRFIAMNIADPPCGSDCPIRRQSYCMTASNDASREMELHLAVLDGSIQQEGPHARRRRTSPNDRHVLERCARVGMLHPLNPRTHNHASKQEQCGSGEPNGSKAREHDDQPRADE